eukprot:SAG11_NODE_6131_length_1382_cov_1.752143_2_plen_93_part_00
MESLAENSAHRGRYDAVTSLEVIEHLNYGAGGASAESLPMLADFFGGCVGAPVVLGPSSVAAAAPDGSDGGLLRHAAAGGSAQRVCGLAGSW